MKKKTLALVTLCAVLLTGCGTNFDITPVDLQTYAAANDFTYTDLSEYYDYSYLDGVYLMEDNETVHVELWDFDTTENAYAWFSENIEHMKGLTGNFSGTISTKSGDYNFKVTSQDTVYHILFSGDKGIYALGYDKATIDETLAGLNVIE